jgi:ABC-type Zn uptake system ZnuABC Zn-binding protein ZnuA
VLQIKNVKFGFVGLVLGLLSSFVVAAPVRVLCTTFPIYQITRNVVADYEGVRVELLLPASLGCPHHYSLTPQDMQKLARADVLIINGLGMEEFLGAPLEKANRGLHVVDSSRGTDGLLHYAGGGHDHHAHGEHGHAAHGHAGKPYEWAGVFVLQPGAYTWTFAKRDGQYADPTMKMLVRKVDLDPVVALAHESERAANSMTHEGIVKKDGEGLQPSDAPYVLTLNQDQDVTAFPILVKEAGTYVFFAEHLPTEFEAEVHYFKNATGADIEPIVQEPQEDHDHGHGDGHSFGDHAEHATAGSVNPHLFASPRQTARLALTIAAGLSEHHPAGAGTFFANASQYAARMHTLSKEMEEQVKLLKNHRIVQPHGIFDYLARDIGLEVVAVTQPHGQEPSAAEMLERVATIREKQAGAVFTEPQYSPKVGQTIAAETGIPTAVLDPVASGPANAPLDYYETVMRKNLETLRATLGVKP